MSFTTGTLDATTYEILRHRLLTINDEQSNTVIRTSGSPIVYEAKDFNTAIMNPDGDGLFIGTYMPILGASLPEVTHSVIRQFAGQIRDGDMYFTNDPWEGVGHANDQALVAPLFHDGHLVCWTGACLHDLDVGSSEPFVNTQARDAFAEGALIPVIKLIENGSVIGHLEHLITRNVRQPALNKLNIRARIAAITAGQNSLRAVLREYGIDIFSGFMREMRESTTAALRRRLLELPDGKWADETYIDHDGQSPDATYRIHCVMTKTGDRLAFDFAGSDGPAPGPINATERSLAGSVHSGIMSTLCFDMTWCPASISDVAEISCPPNSIITAAYPAAVSLSTVTSIPATAAVVRSCISRMLSMSQGYAERAQAYSSFAHTGSILYGRDQHGHLCSTPGSFLVGRGAGAYADRDGLDTGGSPGTPGQSMFNVEVAEQGNPLLLILYRREEVEFGGAGQYRGGAGMEMGLTVRRGYGPLLINWGSMNFHHPQCKGLFGGLPSPVAMTQVFRGSNVQRALTTGRVPVRREDLTAQAIDQVPAKIVGLRLDEGDVLRVVVEGGCGFGDPLDRAIEAIERDTAERRCSVGRAEAHYGVVFDREGMIDAVATEGRRADLRHERLATAEWSPPDIGSASAGADHAPRGMDAAIGVAAEHSPAFLCCRSCGRRFGSPGSDYKSGLAFRSMSLIDLDPLNAHAYGADQVTVREFLCPGCGRRLDLEIRRKGDPPLIGMVLAPALQGDV